MNGTLLRINFCTIDHHTGDEVPVIGDYGPAFAAELKPYIDRLNAAQGLISCPEAEAMAMKLKDENADLPNSVRTRPLRFSLPLPISLPITRPCNSISWKGSGVKR